jgi:hypothetical protein
MCRSVVDTNVSEKHTVSTFKATVTMLQSGGDLYRVKGREASLILILYKSLHLRTYQTVRCKNPEHRHPQGRENMKSQTQVRSPRL